MTDTMKKILALIHETGDRVIMYNNETDAAHVVMTLTEYEMLVSGGMPAGKRAASEPVSAPDHLTDTISLDRINTEIDHPQIEEYLVEPAE